jgi:MFS family permease
MINDKIREVFFNTKPLEPRDYEMSRKMAILEGSSARAVFNLTSGAFLAGYASFLGSDDAFNGIIGSMSVLSGIIALFSPMYFEKRTSCKLQVTLLNFLHRFILGLMVIIPLITSVRSVRLILMAFMYLTAYISISFANPAGNGILIDITPDNIRGRYFGKRESCFLAIGTVFSIVMGRVLDKYRADGNEYGGFIVMFSVILLLSLVDGFLWSKIKEPYKNKKRSSYTIKQIITIPLKNSGFRKIIFFYVLYNIGLQIGGPFFSVYMVTGLKLDYTYITIVGTIGTVVNVILVRVWGKIADHRSWNFVLKNSIMMLGITHALWFFVNPATAFILVPVLHITSGASWAGIGISTFNIQFIFSPEDGRTVYIGFNTALGGIMGFLGTLTGSFLLGVFENIKPIIAGVEFSGMQILFGLSGIMLLVCSAYANFFIKQAPSHAGKINTDKNRA